MKKVPGIGGGRQREKKFGLTLRKQKKKSFKFGKDQGIYCYKKKIKGDKETRGKKMRFVWLKKGDKGRGARKEEENYELGKKRGREEHGWGKRGVT